LAAEWARRLLHIERRRRRRRSAGLDWRKEGGFPARDWRPPAESKQSQGRPWARDWDWDCEGANRAATNGRESGANLGGEAAAAAERSLGAQLGRGRLEPSGGELGRVQPGGGRALGGVKWSGVE